MEGQHFMVCILVKGSPFRVIVVLLQTTWQKDQRSRLNQAAASRQGTPRMMVSLVSRFICVTAERLPGQHPAESPGYFNAS